MPVEFLPMNRIGIESWAAAIIPVKIHTVDRLGLKSPMSAGIGGLSLWIVPHSGPTWCSLAAIPYSRS